MRRKIIEIDEEKCDGCGQCVVACEEGALEVIDGKARVVNEVFCDGLGACIGECPQGALTIKEREAPEFNPVAVEQHLAQTETREQATPTPRGCLGSAVRQLQRDVAAVEVSDEMPPSRLGHWPVQLMLVPPGAPFLKGADIVVCADCVPFAVPDFHARYLDGKAVLVGCPKLDDLEFYKRKLKEIIAEAQPASLTVLRMEVPCCGGLAHAAVQARDAALPEMPLEVHTIGIRGGVTREVLQGKQVVAKGGA